MKDFFGKNVCINDYYKLFDGKFADERGFSVLAYDDPYNVKISYLKSTIVFTLEVEDRDILFSTWDISEVDESTYEYFMYIINRIKEQRKEVSDHVKSFRSKDWIKRNKQLSQLCID